MHKSTKGRNKTLSDFISRSREQIPTWIIFVNAAGKIKEVDE